MRSDLVHVLFALSGTTMTLDLDFFNGEFVVVSELLTGEDFPGRRTNIITKACLSDPYLFDANPDSKI